MASKRLVAAQVTSQSGPTLVPSPLIGANWRQALWVEHTIGPTVEWRLRLDGWTRERETSGVFYKCPHHLIQISFSVRLLSHGVSFSTLLDIARPLNPEFMNWSGGYLSGIAVKHCAKIWSNFRILLLCWSRQRIWTLRLINMALSNTFLIPRDTNNLSSKNIKASQFPVFIT